MTFHWRPFKCGSTAVLQMSVALLLSGVVCILLIIITPTAYDKIVPQPSFRLLQVSNPKGVIFDRITKNESLKLLVNLSSQVTRDITIARLKVSDKLQSNFTVNDIFNIDESSLKILDGRSRTSSAYFKAVHELNLTTLIYNWVNFTEVFKENKGLLVNETFYGWSIWAPKGVTWYLLHPGGLYPNIHDAFEQRLNYTEENKLSRVEHSWSERTPLYFPFCSDVLQSWPNVFLHVITSVLISNDGGIRSKQMKLTPAMCAGASFASRSTPLTLVDEVFVLSQYWSSGFYHWMNENLPKIAFFLPFLHENPSIKIHVMSVNSFVHNAAKILGLDIKRFVSGHVAAKLAYVPRGGGCAFTFPLQGRLLRWYYHRYITGNLLSPCFKHNNGLTNQKTIRDDTNAATPLQISSHCEKNKPLYNNIRNIVVIIKRSRKRWLSQHVDVYTITRSLCSKFGCEVMVFNDAPLPSIEDTMLMFYRAIVIIAPHGAGLSNMIYSKQGTFVIEAINLEPPLANRNINLVNLCYQSQSLSLGYPYHGIVPSTSSRSGPITIDLGYFKKTLHTVLSNYSYYTEI